MPPALSPRAVPPESRGLRPKQRQLKHRQFRKVGKTCASILLGAFLRSRCRPIIFDPTLKNEGVGPGAFVRWSLSGNRWMAPNDVRLIPTLYQRGSKNGLKRLSGALHSQ